MVLAENNDQDELAKLIQLILGCAVNCEDKERKCFAAGYFTKFAMFCNLNIFYIPFQVFLFK